MTEKTRFIYREFDEVPRVMIVRYGDVQLLLESLFDGEKDEYSDTYKVFMLPEIPDEEFFGSWDHLSEMATGFLGEIPVDDIPFDSTKRQHIDTALLERIITKL